MWLQLWVSILQINPVGIFLKVYNVNIRFWSMCISQRHSNLVTPVCLVPGEISEDVWVQELSRFPSSGWVTCMGSSCSSEPVQRGNVMVIWVSILLAWVPAVSRKFYKILFDVMGPVRTNRALMLSKAQINICWYSLNTQISIWEIPLDDRVDEGSSAFKHIPAIYKEGILYMVITLFGKTLIPSVVLLCLF